MLPSGIISSPGRGWLRRRITVGTLLVLTLLALLAGSWPGGAASANGAVRLVVTDETAGPYLLRVGILPADPSLGPLHVSILLREANGGAAVHDATVTVAIDGPGTAEQAPADNSPQNPELYEGNLWLDALGEWSVTLDIDSPLGQASYAFGVRAAAEGGFNLMWIIVAAAAVLVAGSLAWSQWQRRRRLAR